jgi:hypothetical protein
MTEHQIHRVADAIVQELHRQSKMHSEAADAAYVWSPEDERFVGIDGVVNVVELVRAALRS